MPSLTVELAQRSGLQLPGGWRGFNALGGAKRYCRRDSIGDNFVQGAMTKYWAFARGDAWRNPKPFVLNLVFLL